MADRANKPVVTVLLPVYNAGAYLRTAIGSVLVQSFTDFELLLIDDGSTDGSASIIGGFHDPRIRVITHERNRGLVAALNTGLDQARGSFIARMDADDAMRPDRLSKQVAFLEEHPAVAVVAAFVEVMNADGEHTGVWDTDRATITEAEIRRMMPRTNCIAHGTVMLRRTMLGDLRYRGKYEDWDLWLRMLARGLRFAKLPEVLLDHRVHGASLMGALKRERSLEQRLFSTRNDLLRHAGVAMLFNSIGVAVLRAQVRTIARHVQRNLLPALMRDTYRVFTYSPMALLRERRTLRIALEAWNGNHLFLFPYLNAGGAEQVHLDIVGTVKDRDPLVIICGFSTDRALAARYTSAARVLELPRLVNHPWTRGQAHRALANKLNDLPNAVLFSSLTITFFQLLPMLDRGVKTFYLQHAFLFQPEANQQQKGWLPLVARVDRFLFVSQHARDQFGRFLFANNVPRSAAGKLEFISNAVHRFGTVQDHDRTGLLFVGRASAEKRQHLFLAIAAELERVQPGHFRFTVVGDDHGSRDHAHVSFEGLVKDTATMGALYAEHDMLLLTSSREGFPLVIMEAMAHGLVVASTAVGDVPNRLDGGAAFVTSSTDETIVVREMTAFVTALDSDRERMRSMKQAALEHAKREFDPELFRERYRNLLVSAADPMTENN
ncbi:MAG: glycosyltransferase [Flavobacteriales bacterium]